MYTCNLPGALQWRSHYKLNGVCAVPNPHTARMGITAQADDDDE